VRNALARETDTERRLWIIAAGKAAPSMATAAVAALGPRARGGLVIAPAPVKVHLEASPGATFETIAAEHPQPGIGSERAGTEALALAARIATRDGLLVLLSGGASSLMAVAAPGVTLEDKRVTTALLLRAGADINALNTVRKHLSGIKGGQLATAVAAWCRTLAISDVIGDDPSVIGSGPTVGDASTFADAADVLRRFGGLDAYPPAVVERIQRGIRGEYPETPKPGDRRLARAETSVIGSRRNALRGASKEANARGYRVVTIDEPVSGEAREAARWYLRDALARSAALPRPLCIVSSGETTVTVRGNGRGGRNQEFALALVEPLASLEGDTWLASVGTDGVDGPTDAAGAIVYSGTLKRARNPRMRLAPAASFLDNNDAYHYFDRLDDLVHTGPTGTNVGDLQVLLLT
jgi:glycerate-2-kinase